VIVSTQINLEKNPVSHLTGVFKGGRISGWVERNRIALQEENANEVDLELLLALSPGLNRMTQGLQAEEKIQLVNQALHLADESPLSTTRYKPLAPNSSVWVRK